MMYASFFYMKNICLRYTETVPIKNPFIGEKYFTNKNIINIVLSEIILHKINKRSRITFRISKAKIQKFPLRKFLRFLTGPRKS